jgi:hypothetical protein
MSNEWIKPSQALPHPDIEVFVTYRTQVNRDRLIRRAHCFFNQRGERYWDVESTILYPYSEIDAWMYVPEYKE